MVTVSPKAPSNLHSFAVLADEVGCDEDLRLLEFKQQGRTVVKIAQELVHSYLKPRR